MHACFYVAPNTFLKIVGMRMVELAIEASELTKKFGDLVAVDHVNLKVKESELWGLLGPNGAGKTTVVRMLCCLVTPTEVTAKVGGYDIQREASGIRNRARALKS